MSKNKYIETPEKLLDLWEEYKGYVKANPRLIYQLDRAGRLVPVPHEIPLTQQRFEVYVKQKYGWTIGQYFDNQDKLYNDYIAICSHIRMERQADQIEGGMVGQYNASITQRLNGLVDKQEHKTIQEQPLFPDVQENDRDQ
jgi:hypothetical protein